MGDQSANEPATYAVFEATHHGLRHATTRLFLVIGLRRRNALPGWDQSANEPATDAVLEATHHGLRQVIGGHRSDRTPASTAAVPSCTLSNEGSQRKDKAVTSECKK